MTEVYQQKRRLGVVHSMPRDRGRDDLIGWLAVLACALVAAGLAVCL